MGRERDREREGYQLTSVVALTFALRSMSELTIAAWLFSAAMCRAV